MSETEVPLFLNLMRPSYLTIFHELTTDLTVQGRDFLRGAQIWLLSIGAVILHREAKCTWIFSLIFYGLIFKKCLNLFFCWL